MNDRQTTMRGTGWLREAPGNLVPAEWLKIRGRAALRQCIFLPAPKVAPFAAYEQAFSRRDAEAPVTERTPPRRVTPMPRNTSRRPDKFRKAMIFPSPPNLPDERRPRRLKDVISPFEGLVWNGFEQPRPAQRHGHRDAASGWLASPLALGVLLIVAPPAGLALVWSQTKYDRDAKWALTFSTMLFMALATVLAVALGR